MSCQLVTWKAGIGEEENKTIKEFVLIRRLRINYDGQLSVCCVAAAFANSNTYIYIYISALLYYTYFCNY